MYKVLTFIIAAMFSLPAANAEPSVSSGTGAERRTEQRSGVESQRKLDAARSRDERTEASKRAEGQVSFDLAQTIHERVIQSIARSDHPCSHVIGERGIVVVDWIMPQHVSYFPLESALALGGPQTGPKRMTASFDQAPALPEIVACWRVASLAAKQAADRLQGARYSDVGAAESAARRVVDAVIVDRSVMSKLHQAARREVREGTCSIPTIGGVIEGDTKLICPPHAVDPAAGVYSLAGREVYSMASAGGRSANVVISAARGSSASVSSSRSSSMSKTSTAGRTATSGASTKADSGVSVSPPK